MSFGHIGIGIATTLSQSWGLSWCIQMLGCQVSDKWSHIFKLFVIFVLAMITTKRYVHRLLLHRILAWVQLSLVLYALVYAGLHQFNNPAVFIEDCSLVTHHLHQNPDSHQCDLCDYHLRFIILDTNGEITPPTFYQILEIGSVVEPMLDLTDNTTTRGPPVS